VAYLGEHGYATCPPAAAAGDRSLVAAVLALVVELTQQGLPPVFAYLYDATWALLLRLWPVAEAVLGGEAVLEPSFAAFRLDHRKTAAARGAGYVGTNFGKPHRDYSFADAIGADGSLKLLSVWLPLNDVTLQNGCMYAVPRGQDADFADPGNAAALQEPKVPVDGLTALAPHPAGSFLCWSGNTIHWGGASPGRRSHFQSPLCISSAVPRTKHKGGRTARGQAPAARARARPTRGPRSPWSSAG
jgi:hypothetical protein